MGTEMVPETLDFNELTRPSAREEFINLSSVHYKTDTVLSPLLTLFCAILCTRGITEIEVFLCSNFFLAHIVIRIFLVYILLN
jgi:hypothetical protein